MPPAFRAPRTWADWQDQRTAIRATLGRLLGDFPPRPPRPAVRRLSVAAGEGYTLETFEFDDGLGAVVPGYLFLPLHRAGNVPAILYCHWHAGQYDVGKRELLLTNATPVPPGPTLARLGYAVIGIDAPGFGERNGQGPGGPDERGAPAELTAAKLDLWSGRTSWGRALHDQLLALDYLCSRPEVDADRVGVTGISMGSTSSWWLMALDDRPRAAVCVACMTRYQALIASRRLAEHGIYYYVPGMLRHFDTEAVIACCAPRPLLFLTGDSDPGSPVTGVRAIERHVRPIYALGGKPNDFESRIFAGTGHVYLPEMWPLMCAWMDRHVKHASPRRAGLPV